MSCSPALTERLVQIAQEAASAERGRKEAIYAAAAAQLGMSRGTLFRKLKAVTVRPERKRRCDAGKAPPASTPAMNERLVEVAKAAAAAGQGQKSAIYEAAAAELGMTTRWLMKKLAAVAVRPQRRQRSDAGEVALPVQEAELISAMLMESLRKNGKRLMAIGQAVEILRANGLVKAARVDAETGELVPLSDNAVSHALRVHSLHPDQLLRPAPAVELRSLHPNHVWQVDASLCVLYYLATHNPRETGLQVMRQAEFYKNKPANLKRIENDRVWRYVVTDHNSGAVFVHYVFGAESGINLAEAFIAAIQPRGSDPFHGVPYILMMDMGSANTSGLFTNLMRRLQVKPLAHAPENARATGQVENAQNLVECSFESGLRLQPVSSLDELNDMSRRWAGWFNANKVHTRHGRTRFEQWLTISEGQLRQAPPPALCRELLTHTPERRKVNDKLRVSFRGREFDVRAVPSVMVGEWLNVTFNPYATDAACIVDTAEDGSELLHSVPVVARDDAGFAETANVIGEDYRRHADTLADTNRKAVDMLAMDATTLEQAAAARKAKAVPFGGRVDPYKVIEQAPQRTFMPRRGTDLPSVASVQPIEAPPAVLTRFEAAAELARRGVAMSPERNAQVRAWFPDGVPENELDDLARRLTVRAGLRVVAGGAGAANE